MKKILALVLAAAMLVTTVAISGCAKRDDEDKGAVIQAYISEFPNNLDPASVAYGSVENAKLFSLLYEGLFTMDADGKLQKAMAKEYEYYVDARDNTLKLEIELKKSRWSDGIIVDADDFVYAWQRLLDPNADFAAAALLYPIKNAKNVKEGLCSENDLGICATKDNVLQIAFENDFTNVEYFLRRLASPALVPLREDNATKFDDPENLDYLWDAGMTMALPLTNGAFKYKKLTNKSFELERNFHYNDVSSVANAKYDKVVKPYQFITLYEEGKNAEEQLERFENGDIFYLNLSSAKLETIEKAGKVKQEPVASVYTYFFDTTNELFKDARVRKALSIALDREHINELAGRDSKACEGLVPFGIEDTTPKTEFRKVGGNQFVPTGDMEAAKALLKEAGVKKGTITLEYNKDRDFEKDIASYVKKVWKELGFTVKDSGKNGKYISAIAMGKNPFSNKTARVVGMDFQCTTPDAYGMLVGFATPYSGGKVDLTKKDVVYATGNITGFDDKEYNAVCDKIVGALNNQARADALHEAETMLLDKAPVVPLLYHTDVYTSQKLSGIERNMFGGYDFTKVEQKNYHDYLPVDETREPEEDKKQDSKEK